MKNNFIHLHLHSEYSISDSLIRIEDLIKESVKNDIPAVAITDLNNIFSLVKFYKAALKNGVKPIIGIEIDLENKKNIKNYSKVILLCKNMNGFYNLSNLITESYVNLSEDNRFIISKEQLADKADGLIALSGGIQGDLANAIKLEKQHLIEESVNYWKTKGFYGYSFNANNDVIISTSESKIRGSEVIYIDSTQHMSILNAASIIHKNQTARH